MEDRLNELHNSLRLMQMKEMFNESLLDTKNPRRSTNTTGSNAEHLGRLSCFSSYNEAYDHDIEDPGAIPMLKSKDIKLRDLIKNIEQMTKEMNRIIIDSNDATTVKKENELSGEMSAMIEGGKQSSQDVQDIVEELREIQSGLAHTVLTTPAERQMCSNVLATACRGWKVALVQFMDTQDKHKESRKVKLRRQLKLTSPDDSEQMIEEYLNGVPSDIAFASLIKRSPMCGLRRQNDPNDLADLRYRDLRIMEESALELKNQYTYLEQVVIANQDFVDNIENTVKSTATFVEQGHRDLEEIRVQHTKYTKKKLVCAACTLTLVIMIIIIIFVR